MAGQLQGVLRQPLPYSVTTPLSPDVSQHNESYEAIKREGASQTQGKLLPVAIRPVSVFTAAAKCSSALSHLLLARPDSKGVGAKRAVLHCSLLEDNPGASVLWITANKKPRDLREVLIPQSCKAAFWSFSRYA